jgi:hypothetical protein
MLTNSLTTSSRKTEGLHESSVLKIGRQTEPIRNIK